MRASKYCCFQDSRFPGPSELPVSRYRLTRPVRALHAGWFDGKRGLRFMPSALWDHQPSTQRLPFTIVSVNSRTHCAFIVLPRLDFADAATALVTPGTPPAIARCTSSPPAFCVSACFRLSLLYTKLWTHRAIFQCFCDRCVREKAWWNRKSVTQATRAPHPACRWQQAS